MLGLEDLTVGQVSGMIAAGVFLAQVLVPVALPVILSGLLRPRSAPISLSAVSWSVVTRLFHSSLWPIILQTDSAATLSACKSAIFVSIFKTFMLVLIGVAAIVTPLGLYDGIVARVEKGTQTFQYIKDTSSMGLGTPPRNNAPWSRLCGAFLLVPCPNDFNEATVVENRSGIFVDYANDWYDTRIPQEVIEGFQSGRANFEDSVSSTFDIQWRSYVKNIVNDVAKGPAVDNATARTVGSYQPLANLVLTDDRLSVEGLVVDYVNGGIGFRNHSKPTQQHSTWTEDLLFIVPQTVCVDTNLTFEFSIPNLQSEKTLAGYGSNIFKPSIKDVGGFVNLNKTYPEWMPDNTQEDVNLWYRAYRGAWLRNAYSMAYMNITSMTNDTLGTKAFSYLNSEIGKEFPLYYPDGRTATSLRISANTLQVSRSFNDYFQGTESVSNKSTIGNVTTEYNYPSRDGLYPNPFHVDSSDWDDISTLCVGSSNGDSANITNILAKCGILYGAPRRVDGSQSLIFEPGSAWTMTMHSCISTTKATIKTTTFQFNGTDNLSNLKIESISDKVYLNNESKPLWGVENTNLKQKDGSALWGLVTPESATKLNLSTIRKESLYLPSGDTSMGFQNLPATDFAGLAMDMTYELTSSSTVDYSGKSNLAMYRRWQELSTAPDTSAKILNLIWTDIAANMVVGTRGLHDEDTSKKAKREATATQSAKRPQVTTYSHRVKYDMVYGIPAFLALVLVTAATASTIFFMIFGSGRPSNLREILQHTSAGRLLASHNAHSNVSKNTYSNEPTSVWVKGAGKQEFTLGAEGWMKNAQDQVPEYDRKDGLVTSYVPVPNRDVY